MRILHIIDNMSVGGAQSLLVDLVPEQIRQGHKVEVLQLSKPNGTVFLDKLKDAGVRVLFSSEKWGEYNIGHIFSIKKYLRNFDIAHVHLVPALYWAPLSKFLSGSKIPMVLTIHTTGGHRFLDNFVRKVDRYIYQKGYCEIVACSDIAKEKLNEIHPDVRVSVISNGINTTKYSEAVAYTKQKLLGIPEDSFVVTMVARFDYPKRQDVIVDAINMLPDNFHCAFIGGTKDSLKLQEMQKKADDLGISHRVHFLYLRSDIPQILKTSDAICMSSEFEGLSLSCLEGMSSGRPFIASNVDGLKEIVGGYGALFENGDYKELAKIIQHLKEDSLYYDEVVKKCQDKASRYDIKQVAADYINIYKKYIDA